MTAPCTKHPRYKVKRAPTSDCLDCRRWFKKTHLFILAIVKGVKEHAEPTRHFGSLLGFAHYRNAVVEAGYAVYTASNPGGETLPNVLYLKLTPAGEKLYKTVKLDQAPDCRATFWSNIGCPWFNL